ncbi:hypothetical protein [Actinoplanes sp. NPDC049118]|uniref:hypothetical protein n=1 Tax=Actinoplanes sp. NPDC049118 TaxID=3155769 RepID=UPI0033F90D4B
MLTLHFRANLVVERTAVGDEALFSMARELCGGAEGAAVDPYPGSRASWACESGRFTSEGSARDFLIGTGFFIDPQQPVRGVAWQVRAERDGVQITVVGAAPAVLELHAVKRWPGLLG